MQQGISSFVNSKPDYELDPVGIASFQDQAEKLANMGRNGDTYIVHAAEGETVLPMEVLDANPQLKNMLFTQMRDMGIEPERYIVGSELNSINPITGQPEFFLKKIFKGLKNVGKALKKNAAIILPFALGQFGIGTTASGLLGAGLGSLIQGDDPKEALRKAAIGGLSGAAFAGLRNVGRGGGTFAGGVLSDLEQGYQGLRPKNIGETLSNPFKRAQQYFASGSTEAQPSIDNADVEMGKIYQVEKLPNMPTAQTIAGQKNMVEFGQGLPSLDQSIFKGPFNPTYSDLELAASKDFDYLTKVQGFSADKALQLLRKDFDPSFLQKYGIPLAGITGAAALGGFFSAPEEEPEEEILTGQDLIDEDPDKYYIDVAAQPFVDQTQVASAYGIPSISEMSPYPIPTFNAKEGGPAFPRRTGGIGPGLGSGKKDDVPAMLMDGEFVMTRKAVKNAGNGNLNKGIKNMYSLMRNLETRRA